MIIGERIKKERIKRGMSQQQLGDLLGVTKVSICGYETGTRTPSLDTFMEMLNVLKLSPDYLLGRDIYGVSDTEEPYSMVLAKEDMEILKSIKNHPELYSKLISNPKRTIDLIKVKLKNDN